MALRGPAPSPTPRAGEAAGPRDGGRPRPRCPPAPGQGPPGRSTRPPGARAWAAGAWGSPRRRGRQPGPRTGAYLRRRRRGRARGAGDAGLGARGRAGRTPAGGGLAVPLPSAPCAFGRARRGRAGPRRTSSILRPAGGRPGGGAGGAESGQGEGRPLLLGPAKGTGRGVPVVARHSFPEVPRCTAPALETMGPASRCSARSPPGLGTLLSPRGAGAATRLVGSQLSPALTVPGLCSGAKSND